MMMQENNRSLKYTKIDRCENNNCISNDEYYRQILYLNEHLNNKQDIKIIITNRYYLILFIFLILTSQSNSLPIYQSTQNQNNYNQNLPIATVQLNNRITYPQQSFKIYRHFPNLIQQSSYSNGAVVKIYDQTNFNNQQQLTLQIKRERQRRTMTEKIILLFDEDGNGQLTKDELYSMALRSNMFPKFHQYLKQMQT